MLDLDIAATAGGERVATRDQLVVFRLEISDLVNAPLLHLEGRFLAGLESLAILP